MKNIVLITTAQPSNNPRLVKEADALQAAGNQVTILYCYVIPWAVEKDQCILAAANWKYRMVGGSPQKNILRYHFTRLRFKLARTLNNLLGNRFLLAERSQARAFDELLQAAKQTRADWYIGHNLGALAIAARAAKYNGAKSGFDFEDHYRGELHPAQIKMVNRVIYLENKYLPSLHYFSTASDLITDITKKNHPGFKGAVVTLLNCFSLEEQPKNSPAVGSSKGLSLFWFSQTIGLNRGLETLVDALQQMNDPGIELTLVGRCEAAMENYIQTKGSKICSRVHFAGIIQPGQLPAFAAGFDVGMALEIPEPLNRDICLTNKVFTYLLAGNALILSETAMQVLFNQQYQVGETFAVNEVAQLIQKIQLYKNPSCLLKQKIHNYQLAKTQLNWEKESVKLLALIN